MNNFKVGDTVAVEGRKGKHEVIKLEFGNVITVLSYTADVVSVSGSRLSHWTDHTPSQSFKIGDSVTVDANANESYEIAGFAGSHYADLKNPKGGVFGRELSRLTLVKL